MDYARDPNSIAPCSGYEASDERYEAYRQRFMAGIGQDIDTIILPPAWTGNDEDLPGQWSHSDFLGGDPDERSYAQRERDRELGRQQIPERGQE